MHVFGARSVGRQGTVEANSIGIKDSDGGSGRDKARIELWWSFGLRRWHMFCN